jgi:hypothetical protein
MAANHFDPRALESHRTPAAIALPANAATPGRTTRPDPRSMRLVGAVNELDGCDSHTVVMTLYHGSGTPLNGSSTLPARGPRPRHEAEESPADEPTVR